MSLFLVLYVLALCACTAAIVYGIVRSERPRPVKADELSLRRAAPVPKRARRLAA